MFRSILVLLALAAALPAAASPQPDGGTPETSSGFGDPMARLLGHWRVRWSDGGVGHEAPGMLVQKVRNVVTLSQEYRLDVFSEPPFYSRKMSLEHGRLVGTYWPTLEFVSFDLGVFDDGDRLSGNWSESHLDSFLDRAGDRMGERLDDVPDEDHYTHRGDEEWTRIPSQIDSVTVEEWAVFPIQRARVEAEWDALKTPRFTLHFHGAGLSFPANPTVLLDDPDLRASTIRHRDDEDHLAVVVEMYRGLTSGEKRALINGEEVMFRLDLDPPEPRVIAMDLQRATPGGFVALEEYPNDGRFLLRATFDRRPREDSDTITVRLESGDSARAVVERVDDDPSGRTFRGPATLVLPTPQDPVIVDVFSISHACDPADLRPEAGPDDDAPKTCLEWALRDWPRWTYDDRMFEQLLVVGRDLEPSEGFAREPVASDHPLVRYEVDTGPDHHPSEAPWIERVMGMYLRDEPAERHDSLRALDAVLVDVEVGYGTEPGPRTLTMNGAQGTWDWRVGNIAHVHFVQEVDGAWEPVDQLALHQEFRVSLRTESPLPVDRLSVDAHQTVGPPGSGPSRIALTRSPADSALYLSAPLVVRDPGAPPADSSRTWDDRWVRAWTAPVDGRIEASLTDGYRHWFMGARDAGAWIRSDHTLWTDALRDVAACYDVSPPSDVRSLAAKPAGGIEETLVPFVNAVLRPASDAAPWFAAPFAVGLEPALDFNELANTQYTYGDHAAALLLARTAQEMLALRTARMGRPDVDSNVHGWARSVGRELDRGGLVGDLPVTDPAGGTSPLFAVADPREAVARFGLDREEAERWRVGGLREAFVTTQRHLQGAYASLDGIDCEFERLLDLTSRGFGPAKAVLLPRLVRRDLAGTFSLPRFTPDRTARAYVGALEGLMRTVEGQREWGLPRDVHGHGPDAAGGAARVRAPPCVAHRTHGRGLGPRRGRGDPLGRSPDLRRIGARPVRRVLGERSGAGVR